MKEILVASHNQGKLEEMRAMVSGYPLRLRSPDQLGIKWEVEETGQTFDENALIKARALHERAGGWVMADDSGLCVDALGGAPGIYSARYGGPPASDESNMDRLLEEMRHLPPAERTAAFCCSLALIDPQGREALFRGRTEGSIALTRSGSAGFGYDPIFLPLGESRSMAELDAGEKNRISHRGRAIDLFLKEYFGDDQGSQVTR
ncbi:MAG TPA: RdgB/HAM1 family non-canonical purine NTP pyrophosphatase [Clostridia bacterium]|nr:RdgB/HAM1 family non-canonical purine NTP pyrophosphatase [Clostridia bacterium]